LQWVASIDLTPNEEANANIIVKNGESFTEQAEQVMNVTVTYRYRTGGAGNACYNNLYNSGRAGKNVTVTH